MTVPFASPKARIRVESAEGVRAGDYDSYLAGAEWATPFHRRAWGAAIEGALGHKAHHLIAYCGDRPCGILPLIEIRSALFGKSLVSTAFGVEGGPLFDDETALAALDDAAWKIAQTRGIGILEYRGDRRLHPDWTAKTETYANFARELTGDEDADLKAIPRKQRAEVRKSLQLGLDVRVARDARAVDEHFHVYATSVRNLGTPVFPKALFAALLREYGDDADILTVSKDGTPVASVLSLYDRGTVYPYYGGGTEAARSLRANDHMYWMLMRHAAARGCRRFDFGRSKTGTGAYAFKKNWGFEPRPLVYEYRLAPGEAMPDLNPMNPKYRLMTEVWQRLPLWLANGLGPFIARNLG